MQLVTGLGLKVWSQDGSQLLMKVTAKTNDNTSTSLPFFHRVCVDHSGFVYAGVMKMVHVLEPRRNFNVLQTLGNSNEPLCFAPGMCVDDQNRLILGDQDKLLMFN